jgi:hypothetical protein
MQNPTPTGLEVIELDNADLVSEWNPNPSTDTTSFTLPIYPAPGDLPTLHIER